MIENLIGKDACFRVGQGICRFALAMGGKIAKEKINHYGTNHPVRVYGDRQQYMHNRTIPQFNSRRRILEKERQVFNITDNSVEGIADKNKVLSIIV